MNTIPLPDYCSARVLVLGCGNILFGDDGFGPEAIRYLKENFKIPPWMCVIDAGLSAREILFTVTLSSIRPQKIIIVDAVDAGKKPGEVFELDISEIPLKKIDDFSMHQLPTSNLLRELKDFCGVDVKIIAIQVENIPDSVSPGISEKLIRSIPDVCKIILEEEDKNARVEDYRIGC